MPKATPHPGEEPLRSVAAGRQSTQGATGGASTPVAGSNSWRDKAANIAAGVKKKLSPSSKAAVEASPSKTRSGRLLRPGPSGRMPQREVHDQEEEDGSSGAQAEL